MTAVADQPDVVEATEADLRRALKRALKRAGVTYAELAEQAKTGRFESVQARLAWVAIGDLGELAASHRDRAVPIQQHRPPHPVL